MKTYILWLALMVMGAVLGVHAVEVEPVKHGNMIRGHVIEKDSEEHLPYATILIVETGEGTISDDTGHFVFKKIPLMYSYLRVSS